MMKENQIENEKTAALRAQRSKEKSEILKMKVLNTLMKKEEEERIKCEQILEFVNEQEVSACTDQLF